MHSSRIFERVGAIQVEVHFWNKVCFTHWVEWEAIWSKLGYIPESSSARACTSKNAKGSAATNEDLLTWQRALDLLRDSRFLQSFSKLLVVVKWWNFQTVKCFSVAMKSTW
jgi:hypothetical protein